MSDKLEAVSLYRWNVSRILLGLRCIMRKGLTFNLNILRDVQDEVMDRISLSTYHTSSHATIGINME